MKTILALVVAVELVLALGAFVMGEAVVAATLVAGAIFAGTGYAIVDRLEQIRDALRARPVEQPQPARPSTPAPPLAEFDAAKVVEQMESARRSPPNTASKLPANVSN